MGFNNNTTAQRRRRRSKTSPLAVTAVVLLATSTLPFSVHSDPSLNIGPVNLSGNSTRIEYDVMEGLHDLTDDIDSLDKTAENSETTSSDDETEQSTGARQHTDHVTQDEEDAQIVQQDAQQQQQEDAGNSDVSNTDHHHAVPVVTTHSETEHEVRTSITLPLHQDHQNPVDLDRTVLASSDCEKENVQKKNIGEQQGDELHESADVEQVESVAASEESGDAYPDSDEVSTSDETTTDEAINPGMVENDQSVDDDGRIESKETDHEQEQEDATIQHPDPNVHSQQATKNNMDEPKLETELDENRGQSTITSSRELNEFSDSIPGEPQDSGHGAQDGDHEAHHGEDERPSKPDETTEETTKEQQQQPETNKNEANVYLDDNGVAVIDLDGASDQAEQSMNDEAEKAAKSDGAKTKQGPHTETSEKVQVDDTNPTDNVKKEQRKNDNEKLAPKGSFADFFVKAKSKSSTKSSFNQELERQEKLSSYYSAPKGKAAPKEKQYQGEPWGYFRPTRRLPDLQLLYMLFHGMHNRPPPGLSEVQQMMSELQNDPLFDADLVNELNASSEDGWNLFDGKDNSDNDENAGADSDNATGGADPASPIKSSDVNSDFVEGLDDIDKFFEGVDPPDELDVGASGTSIQEVLMGKGKQILVKKLLQLSHGIQSGWKKLCSSVGNLFSKDKNSDANATSDSSLYFHVQDLPRKIWEAGKFGAEKFLNVVDIVIDYVENFFEKDDANDEDILDFSSAME